MALASLEFAVSSLTAAALRVSSICSCSRSGSARASDPGQAMEPAAIDLSEGGGGSSGRRSAKATKPASAATAAQYAETVRNGALPWGKRLGASSIISFASSIYIGFAIQALDRRRFLEYRRRIN